MSDDAADIDVTGAEAVADAAPIASPADAPARTDGGDNLDTLLGEWTAKDSAGEQRPASGQPEPRGGYSDDELLAMQMREDSNRVILESVLAHQFSESERIHQERLQQQARADYEEILDEAAPYLADLPGVGDPRKEADRWLRSQASLDPHLSEAFDHRRDSPQHQAHAVKMIKRAFKQMHAELSHRPDPDLTADRWAVAAAMRGGSNAPPPAETSRSYARRVEKMTDAQFQEEADRVMGR